MKTVNLEGTLMNNNEFICYGKSMFLTKDMIQKFVTPKLESLEAMQKRLELEILEKTNIQLVITSKGIKSIKRETKDEIIEKIKDCFPVKCHPDNAYTELSNNLNNLLKKLYKE